MNIKINGKYLTQCPKCGSNDLQLSISNEVIWCGEQDDEGRDACDWQMAISVKGIEDYNFVFNMSKTLLVIEGDE